MIKEWEKEILEAIEKLYALNSNNRGAILTEGDLECTLYNLLSQSPLLSEQKDTLTNSWKSSSIHSQVTWFRKNKKSGFRVDLTILDPTNLDINQLNIVKEYPNKGFFHDGPIIGIELKFIRSTAGSEIKKQSIKDYKKIVKKLIPAKEANIHNDTYSNLTENEFSVFAILLYKTEFSFKIGLKALTDYIMNYSCPENVYPVLIYDSQIEYLNQNNKAK